MKRQELAKLLDVTYISTTATLEGAKEHIAEAKRCEWRSVIGPRCWIPMYAKELKGSSVLLGSGNCDINGSDNNHIKCYTARSNRELGCSEVDMVMNIGYFNSHMYADLIEDIRNVKSAIGDGILKCAVEAGLWDDGALERAGALAAAAGADWVKTGTWGAPKAPELREVKILRRILPDNIRIKVAPFSGTLTELEEFIAAGADCFGVVPEQARALWKEALDF